MTDNSLKLDNLFIWHCVRFYMKAFYNKVVNKQIKKNYGTKSVQKILYKIQLDLVEVLTSIINSIFRGQSWFIRKCSALLRFNAEQRKWNELQIWKHRSTYFIWQSDAYLNNPKQLIMHEFIDPTVWVWCECVSHSDSLLFVYLDLSVQLASFKTTNVFAFDIV